jgi:glutaconate CoA-transferase, subunit B
MMMEYSPAELMVVAAARRLREGERIFVGVGLPNLAANLAKRLHAPGITLIYESGVVDAKPNRLPMSVGDASLVTNSALVCSMFEVFCFYLQRGLIDVGFLGGAQIDRFGNINATVIGSYDKPSVRLPGSGGSCEIAANAKRILMLSPHNKRRFPERVDFITSPGFLDGRKARQRLGLRGGGPEAVVTDLGVMEFDESGEMVLTSLHPAVSVEQVAANTGWPLKVASSLTLTDPPTAEELRIMRVELDPDRVYLKSRE